MERDAESGLDHTLNRKYSSNLGRWLSPDPKAGNITNPQSLNRYAYVLNNPTNGIDPLGLFCVPGYCPDDADYSFFLEVLYSLLVVEAPVNPDLREIHDRDKPDKVQALIDKGLKQAKALLANPCCANFLKSLMTKLGLKPDLDHLKSTLDKLTIVPAPPLGPNAPWWQTQTTAYVYPIGQNSTVDVVKPGASNLAPTLLHDDFHTISTVLLMFSWPPRRAIQFRRVLLQTKWTRSLPETPARSSRSTATQAN